MMHLGSLALGAANLALNLSSDSCDLGKGTSLSLFPM